MRTKEMEGMMSREPRLVGSNESFFPLPLDSGTEMGEKNGWNTFIPAFEYCTDNAAMIAITGYYKYLEGQFADLSVTASARANW